MGGMWVIKQVISVDDDNYLKMLKGLGVAHSKYYILWLVGVHTGLRVSDILSIRVRDVKSKMRVREQKTGKYKVIELSDDVLKAVKGHINDFDLRRGDYICFSTTRRKDKPLSRIQAYKIIKRVSRESGLEEIGTHSMRKTYALNLFKQSGDIFAVQKALNHKYVSTTLMYLIDKHSKLVIERD